MNINLTLITQTVVFFFFVWFCRLYVWAPLLAVLKERQKKIEEGLQASESAEKELEVAKSQAAEQLLLAKKQASDILLDAKNRASTIVSMAETKAKEEADLIKTQAYSEIEIEKNKAKESLRQSFGGLVIKGINKVLGDIKIEESTHKKTLEKLSSEF